MALLFTHEPHLQQSILIRDREDVMKKVPKLSQADLENSDDSRTLKRKSMSLNEEGLKDAQSGAGLGSVFTTSFYLNDLSREEKIALRKRLRSNLEQVQKISAKIEARKDQLAVVKIQVPTNSNSLPVCPAISDAHASRTDNGGSAGKEVTSEPASTSVGTPRASSLKEGRLGRQLSVMVCDGGRDSLAGTPGIPGKEKRTPKANQLYLNSEFVSGKDKMPPPEKIKPKAAVGLKRGGQGKDGKDSKRQKIELARSKRMSDLMKQCGTLLKRLRGHKHAWVFNEPVDVEKLGLHDYNKVIKKPMDLGTIKKKLESGLYPTPSGLGDDVKLTFQNAMTYNPHDHDVHVMAEGLKQLFEERWKDIEKKYEEEKLKMKVEEETLAVDPGQSLQLHDLKQHLRSIEDQIHSLAKTTRPTPPGRPSAQAKPKPDDIEKRPMTFDEKRKLSVNLESLPGDKLERIVQIIKKRNPDLSQNEDEIEVDIDSFDNDTLWELDRFVTNCMKSRGKTKKGKPAKSSHVAVQPLDTVGETPRRSRPGGEGGEEDVDIDDDLAPTNFAPVVIDKDGGGDAGPLPVKSTDDSSSDSESGSSGSSDSESGSSSGSESEAEDAQSADAGSKANHDKAENACPALRPLPSLQEPVGSGAVLCDQKGSSAPETDVAKISEELTEAAPAEEPAPERQVSPDKLLRAALLRGRFADTILKAQEKTLPVNKNDKVDPEKLKRDREELEKHQREEKARLQAEAKAAEASKRKAEEEAVLEAKRKRAEEREVARRNLEQMERTVEIDENSEILKDLERLRSVSMDQQVGSSGEEASPGGGSPDGLPTFALQGGNPLEQLGLFMKDDEDEDEHHEEETGGEIEKVQSVPNKVVDANGNGQVEVDVEEGEID